MNKKLAMTALALAMFGGMSAYAVAEIADDTLTNERPPKSAMEAGDVLAEAERRYLIIAEMMDPRRELREDERPLTGTEVKALSIEADRLMHKIVTLRVERVAAAEKEAAAASDESQHGKVVAFNADRFRRSG